MNLKKIICFCLGHEKKYGLTETDECIYNGYCKRCNETLGFYHWKNILKPPNTTDKSWKISQEEYLNEIREEIKISCEKRNQKISEKISFHKFTQIQKGRFLLIIPEGIIWFVSIIILCNNKNIGTILFSVIMTCLFIVGNIILILHDYKEFEINLKKEYDFILKTNNIEDKR
jgi:hypothetical protein